KSADKIEKPEKRESTETPQTPMLSAKDRIFHNLFKQVQTLVYERNYELGAVFEKNIRFIDFDSQTKTLTWESLATHKDKELLRERFKIVKSIVDGVFGKGENIKIALKNHSENKSALEEIKEFKFPSLKPKPTTETTAETKENDTKEAIEKETKENDTKEVQETQPKETPTALQEFMANYS
ncbi:DNA polymerase III subunit gamma/tau, partial [Helicobacter pylori]